MKSRWSEAEAAAAVERWRRAGEALALRTYSARLLGAEPALVLHGGGNTSVKTTVSDLFGDPVEVICVKGSGWDLAAIEPAGHPAVRLGPLRRLRALPALSDAAMVNALRTNMLDAAGPTPSVETLLHAFLPHVYIDHSHASAALALANQPDAAALLAEVFGARVALVPYVMPGFALAKAAAEAFDAAPGVEGLVLINHGLFSFGATAQESYERTIALVTLAEDFLARHAPAARAPAAAAPSAAELARIGPRLRGALARAAGEAWPRHWVWDLRSRGAARAVADDPRLADWAGRGVATPDHVIRTKAFPLVLPRLGEEAEAWGAKADPAVAAFVGDYRAYFARQSARVGEGRVALDPLPRVAAIPGVGLAGLGTSAKAAAIAADIAEAWATTVLAAELVGRFTPLGEADTFDMEYWSLEQAKLGATQPPPLAGRIVAITGAGGAIGAATARAFRAAGAELALIDVAEGPLADLARATGGLAIGADVTDGPAVHAAFEAVAAGFGGLDIVVSNAGAALAGPMASLADAELRASFAINVFAHQWVAQAAIGVFRAQGMGGVLLFNASKQALNPGPDFGAYGTAKAALLALMRQYALEHGGEGVRVNAINPDRVRSGLLTSEMIEDRARARAVSPETYMAGNLLGREVVAEDVAQAFLFAAQMRATTGAIIPVDGGNVAAMPR